ncbi:hypothetical protein FJT64_004047 [Amphibalanus amphitrite]|uniref:Uncharacterized protein n=1 Tax=Amphibalanus amphitrite TaxID=1232801 RepID=A0A6A4W478_AMPAM|nr:hypothetical protein FJT64_004047 [Amphibalanus amphitrite]
MYKRSACIVHNVQLLSNSADRPWLCQCRLRQGLTPQCQPPPDPAAAPSDCCQLTQLCPTGPEVTKPRWPGRYGSGLSVSLQGVAADTISHLATELGSRITLLVTDAQITTIPSQLRGAIIRVEPNTVILPAGVGDSELTELRSSRETVKRLSVSAADLPRLRGQLPEGLKRLNIRGPDVTEPRWPEWKPWFHGLSVSLQGVTADTISHLADLGRTVTRLEIYDCPDLTAGSLEPLTRCPELTSLTLSGGIPDTVSLEPLTRCRGLQDLSVTAADLPLLRGQLPEGLRRLNVRDTGRAVLTALKETDLQYSYGRPRTIWLIFPEELYDQLKSQEGDGVDSVDVEGIDALHYRPCSDELTAERPSQSAGAAS